VTIVALVVDLGDRMRIGEGVRFVRRAADVGDLEADLVLVDITVPGALDAIAAAPGRVIAFGPHVATDDLAAAEAAGAEAMPRSRFFRERPWLDAS
jgi:hypothetical protein